MSAGVARVRSLSEQEARAFLARQQVGRIAYSLHDRVDIEPLHFAFDGQWIFARTSAGTKLSTLAHHPWCAFETDKVHGLFRWTSVVVRGSVHLLDPETGSADTYGRALDAMREIVPQMFSAEDPSPQRTVLLGIFIHEIEGRESLGVSGHH